MRHIGILAHSVPGSAQCYEAVARHGEQHLGDDQHPDVTLDCIPMGRSMPAWEADDPAAVRPILAASIERLARAGCDFFVCPDNTAHLALDEPGPSFALPGLHIADVVAAAAAANGYRTVGILGTRWTMTAAMYPQALAAHGIASRIPAPADRDDIQRITFGELTRGVVTAAAHTRFVEIVHALAEDGCDAVALVCTEHPLLLTPDVSPLPTLNSPDLLARAAIVAALDDRELPPWTARAP